MERVGSGAVVVEASLFEGAWSTAELGFSAVGSIVVNIVKLRMDSSSTPGDRG
jgi:hypothetical protein